MKQTKNKYLRRLVKNYEIELNRPKGLKLLDIVIKSIPNNMPNVEMFVSDKVYKECDFITRYKGFKVNKACVNNAGVIAADPSNLYLQWT